MFDIGWSELLIVAIVAIIVVGPKELPALLRNIGRYLGKLKSMSQEFRSQFNEAIKDTEIEKLRDDINDMKQANFVKNDFDYEKEWGLKSDPLKSQDNTTEIKSEAVDTTKDATTKDDTASLHKISDVRQDQPSSQDDKSNPPSNDELKQNRA